MAAPNIRYIRPTGDTSGVADTANLQAALAVSGIKAVVLDGRYYTTSRLNVTACSLIGATRSVIQYVGSSTSDYAIKVTGGSDDTGFMQNIAVTCGNLCRGILFHTIENRTIADNVRVEAAKEVGCDIVDCWGSNYNTLRVGNTRGISLRMHRCNSFLALNTLLASCYCFRSSVASENTALFEYACDNGIVAAAALYNGTGGYGTYTEDWPSATDTSVVDSRGGSNYVRTPAADRAPMVCSATGQDQDLVTFDNLLIEPAYTADYPTISGSGNTLSLRNVRWESGYHRGPLIQLRSGNGLEATHFTLDNARLISTKNPSEIVHVYGDAKFISINQLLASSYVTNHIVVLDGGAVNTVSITNTRVPAEITEPNVVALDNGATLIGSNRVYGDVNMTATGAIYLGDPSTDGTWKIVRDGNNLLFQRRESGSYATKTTTTP